MPFHTIWRKVDHWLAQFATRGTALHKRLHYFCAACGLLTGTLFFLAFVAASFLPPLRPWWSPERTQEHYQKHLTGIHAASVLMMFSGATFIPFYCAVADQMQRIPDVPWILPQIQLAAGTASTIGFFMPAMALGVAGFRVDRNPEIQELTNDTFWLYAVMPFTSFIPLGWSWAYAILLDKREQPLFPRGMAIGNFLSPLGFLFSIAVHITATGPFSWAGACGFWIPLIIFGCQFAGEVFYLFRAIRRDYMLNEAQEVAQAVRICSDDSRDTSK